MKLNKKTITIIISILIILIANKVKAVTIVLDPGHGGSDTGAIANDNKTYERDVNLKIAKYLKDYLDEYEVKTILTHEGFSDGKLSLYKRAMTARNNKADLFVSLHINSMPGGKAVGAEVYVSANTSLPKYKEETTKLGNKILGNLNKLGLNNRGVLTRKIVRDKTDKYSDGTLGDYYGVIRFAMRGTIINYGIVSPKGAVSAVVEKGEGIPTILIEHCYINSSDFEFMNSDEKIRKLAIADGQAIVEQYKLKKKVDEEENKEKEKETNNNESDEENNENNEDNIKNRLKKIKINSFKLTEKTLTNISEKTQEDNFLKNIETPDDIIIKLENTNNSFIATGTKVMIKDKDTDKSLEEYNCVIYGDVNGDGNINSGDLLTVRKHLLKTRVEKEGNKLQAMDSNHDGNINSGDLLIIRKHLLGTYKIQ